MNARKKWLPNEIKYLIDNYPSMSTSQIANFLNINIEQIYRKANSLELKKSNEFLKSSLSGRMSPIHILGKDTRFKKGHISFNKGKKWDEYMNKEAQEKAKKTNFKKGQLPHNTKNNGFISPRLDKRTDKTYLYIRLGKSIWKELQRYIWEQNFGKLNPGDVLRFKDGNTKNCTIENLELINIKENMIRNSVQRFPEELRNLIMVKAAFNRQINKLKSNE
jgi:hypothetical protein